MGPPDDQLYEGKTVRDIVIGLDKEVKHIKGLLQGNGHAGLISRVDDVEEVVTTHKTYFVLMGAALSVIAYCILSRLIG